ncbi:hypothetical protein XM75_u0122 [Vibrio vulnificus]|uniref:hypothetical protein n=1 Tax=Vibrio vulnificus TaxID=672 RepID=UPI0009B6A704|nr:hypothetical protein [Vibrio vulnificus]OQK43442.1 hypothetical protein XM75_u0122 [Vibrio vulnificus]
MLKNRKTLATAIVLSLAAVSTTASANAIDISDALTYIAGALVAVAGLGAAYLGLNSLKTVWSKITATRV